MKNGIKHRKRWIQSVIETARQDSPALPWQRGARRAAFHAKRRVSALSAKSA